jgi:hypothetical protein
MSDLERVREHLEGVGLAGRFKISDEVGGYLGIVDIPFSNREKKGTRAMTIRAQSFNATIQREGDSVRLSLRSSFKAQDSNQSYGDHASFLYPSFSDAIAAIREDLDTIEDVEDDADDKEWDALEGDREPTDDELDALEESGNDPLILDIDDVVDL